MEKVTGTVFDIRRFTMNDGPGVRTTVFLKGCPLRCVWCYNPEGRNPGLDHFDRETHDVEGNITVIRETVGREYTVDELAEVILSERVVMQQSSGGVTFSGGEPMLQHEFLMRMLERCRAEGLHTVIDTSGYAERELFESVLPLTDLFLFDLKHTVREKHLEYTSVSSVKIIENLEFLLNSGARVWLRIPVIPGFNKSRRDFEDIISTIKTLPEGVEQVQLIPFRQTAAEKYLRMGFHNTMGNTPSLKPAQLNPYKRMLRRAGFNTIIS